MDHGLRVWIDRSPCADFAQCVGDAMAFRLDGDEPVTFDAPEGVERDRVVDSGNVCPIEALTVLDTSSNKDAP